MCGIGKGLDRSMGQNREFRNKKIFDKVAEAIQQMVLEQLNIHTPKK